MRKGQTMSDEQKLVLSFINTGESHPMFGTHPSDETKKLIGDAVRGEKNPMFGTVGEKSPNFGTHHSAATKKLIGDSKRGKARAPFSDEWKKNLSESHFGMEHSPETKKLMSKHNRRTMLGKHPSAEALAKRSGANSYMWRGGVSFAPYSLDWTRTLRRSIRERDHYTCRLCGAQQSDRAFSVHHIDYVKSHCDPVNLVTLCQSCHTKTNLDREFWTGLFQHVMCSGTGSCM